MWLHFSYKKEFLYERQSIITIKVHLHWTKAIAKKTSLLGSVHTKPKNGRENEKDQGAIKKIKE